MSNVSPNRKKWEKKKVPVPSGRNRLAWRTSTIIHVLLHLLSSTHTNQGLYYGARVVISPDVRHGPPKNKRIGHHLTLGKRSKKTSGYSGKSWWKWVGLGRSPVLWISWPPTSCDLCPLDHWLPAAGQTCCGKTSRPDQRRVVGKRVSLPRLLAAPTIRNSVPLKLNWFISSVLVFRTRWKIHCQTCERDISAVAESSTAPRNVNVPDSVQRTTGYIDNLT